MVPRTELLEHVWEDADDSSTNVVDVYVGHHEPRALLESTREEVDRMSRIVDNLLTLARVDEGRGLAICLEIADAHGGRVWVESEEGEGSSFSLALPGARG